MKISLSHVTELIGYVDIHLNVSTADTNNYYEALFDLGEKTGRFMVVHVRKQRNLDGTFPFGYVSIEGTIYNKDGEIAVVPYHYFRTEDTSEIAKWIAVQKNEWEKELEPVEESLQKKPPKMYVEIKEGQHGFFDDGRHYTVVSVPSITMCTNGSLRWGDVLVKFDDDEEPYIMRVSEFMEHITTAGNLTIEK